jgi:glyceraldehyde 3-phosphate dehydrogenase
VFAEKEPEKLPWKDLGVDIVLECTGFFTNEATPQSILLQAPKK